MRKDERPSPARETRHPTVTTGLPGAELLLDFEHAREIWLENIEQNKEFSTQIEIRRRLNDRLDAIPALLLDQEIHEDPHDLAYWHPDPVALFTLFPTDEAWVREVTKAGPTTRTVKGGAFANVKTAG